MLENDTNLQVFCYWYSLSIGRGISVLLVRPATLLLILHVPVLFSGWWSLPCPHLLLYLHSELKVILQASLLFPTFLHFSISPFLHFSISPFLHFSISPFLHFSISPFPFPHFHFLRSWFCHYPLYLSLGYSQMTMREIILKFPIPP